MIRTSAKLAVLVMALAACNQSDYGTPDLPNLPPPVVPNSDDDVSCATNDDCGSSEACVAGTCRIASCMGGPYRSLQPLNPRHFLFADHELVTADDSADDGRYFVDRYVPDGESLAMDQPLDLGTSRIVDVSGGFLDGNRPERMVMARVGASAVYFETAAGEDSIELDYEPVAVAVGDTDSDGVDEIAALAADGRFSICEVQDGTCSSSSFSGDVDAKDVAAGDVDGDGAEELVFVIERNGQHRLEVFNDNVGESGESQRIGVDIDGHFRVAVGDLDGDGISEIATLRDRGGASIFKKHDHINLHRLDNTGLVQFSNISVDKDTYDLAMADLEMDGKFELILLEGARDAHVYRWGDDTLDHLYETILESTSSPRRIAAIDSDGDSPTANQLAEPELVTGPMVPMVLAHFPPYSREFSDGVPSVFVGSSDTKGEALEESMSVSAGVEVGFSAELGGFGASLSTSVTRGVRSSYRTGRYLTFGTRSSAEPDTFFEGKGYSAVLLASVCYHAYSYQIEDPDGRLDGEADGGEMVVLVPVSGRATIWSSTRYNAVARATGDLPVFETPIRLGDPFSYPKAAVKDDGSAIPERDRVFPDTPILLVSDSGEAGFWLTVREDETNTETLSTDVNVSASASWFGAKIGYSRTIGSATGMSITVGSNTMFGGSVPPVRDNPSTPEDEYATHSYSFQPVVYRDRYERPDGSENEYYVITYAVANE